jgi:tetratricopeptide (TPR) repeat protein
VSLLLDALKRAEQEKLARQGARAAAQEEIPTPFEPPPRPSPPPSPSNQPLELEAVTEAPAVAPMRAAREREAAKAVFTAKQHPPRAQPNKALIAIGALVLLLLIGSGVWFWYELNRVPPVIARTPFAAPRPVTPAPPMPPAEELKPETALPVPPPSFSTPKARVQQSDAEQMVMALLKDSQSVPAAPLKLSRTLDAPRVQPEVAQGYDALRGGDLALAKTRYQAALAIDPFNVDASLGLATIAARAGDRAAAAAHYRRALELDSKNASALAGLASLADYSRPESLEAQMRADLTRHPQSSPLHFALGNLYAAQSRWTDAQAAYFEAHRLAPDDADIAYNLAVSLDHLGQSRSAIDYYQRAFAASRAQAVQFDRAQVQRRLAELKP